MTRHGHGAASALAAWLALSLAFAHPAHGASAGGAEGARNAAPRRATPPVAPSASGESVTESRYTWHGELRDEHRAIAALLRAARARTGVPVDVRERVNALKRAVLGPALDVLVQGRVPCVAPGDEPQKLSAQQRDLLLELCASCELADVRAVLQTRLAAEKGGELGLAALRVFGAAGDAKDLARLAALAPRRTDGALTSDGRDALRAAYTGILARHPGALETAGALVDAVDDAAADELVLALGETGDPRAIGILFRIARRNTERARTAVAMVPRIGSSGDANVDAEFSAWLASELRPDRVEWTRAIVRALGELDDGSSAPELITLLSHTHTGVADAALAALRRMSRLEYPPQPALWQAWYDREAKWYDRERPRQRNALERGRASAALEALRAYSQHEWRRAQLAQDVCGAFSRREAPVRELACEVLGSLGSRVALPALVETLGDPATTVQTAAWRALQRITGATLPNDREVWSEYLAAPARPALVQAIARQPSRP